MERIHILGGRALSGRLSVSGSKNAALAVIAASLLANDEVTLHNVPQITDTIVLLDVLAGLGAKVAWQGESVVCINPSTVSLSDAPDALARKIRAAFPILGPLLARNGRAKVPMPGGCAIGPRPVNFHVDGLRLLGAEVSTRMDHVEATCDRLRGATIYLDFPSAGTTTHLMSTATLAQGTTYIENAALEPEVVDVAEFLTKLGAKIAGAGTKSIVIEGVKELHGGEFRVREDRIEAATYAVAAAVTGGDVSLDFATISDIGPVVSKLSAAGCEIREEPFGARIIGPARCRAVDVKTMPHPGFPTDVQQPFTALMACSDGTSVVTETVYEWRFKQVGELIRMGADIKMEGESAIIKGVPRLHGTEVTATDLRAGAALVIAGLAAEGETRVVGVDHIERGYQNIIAKLAGLGAVVAKFDETKQVELCLA